jgi:hypothetical protein
MKIVLPKIIVWIEKLLFEYRQSAVSVKSLNLSNLPKYFNDGLLTNTKVVFIDKVPMPPLIEYGLTDTNIVNFEKLNAYGITFKDTYFINSNFAKDESLHFHELVHVIQWSYLGVKKFLSLYAIGLLKYGYEKCPLELMAYNLQQDFIDNMEIKGLEAVIVHEVESILNDLTEEEIRMVEGEK